MYVDLYACSLQMRAVPKLFYSKAEVHIQHVPQYLPESWSICRWNCRSGAYMNMLFSHCSVSGFFFPPPPLLYFNSYNIYQRLLAAAELCNNNFALFRQASEQCHHFMESRHTFTW